MNVDRAKIYLRNITVAFPSLNRVFFTPTQMQLEELYYFLYKIKRLLIVQIARVLSRHTIS